MRTQIRKLILNVPRLLDDLDLTIVSREKWGAVPAKSQQPYKHLPSEIRFLHTTSVTGKTRKQDQEILKTLQRSDMHTDGLRDIKYNFLVGFDGTIYEGRGWKSKPESETMQGAMQEERLDIAYIGDYTNTPPRWEVIKKAFQIFEIGINSKNINHRCKIIHLSPKQQKLYY